MPTQTPGNSPAPTPNTNTSVNPLTRQLKLYKILALVLLIALLGGVGAFLIVRHLGQPVAILLDGKPITHVRNTAAANRLLTEAEQEKVGGAYPESSLVRLQKVQFQHIGGDIPLDPDAVAKSKLRNALQLNVHAFAILVNGHVSLGLPTDAIAADTEQMVKEHFAQMPPDADIVGEPAFTQRVEIKPRAVSAARARSSAETAAPYFWTPPSSKIYVVKRGDTGLLIAHRNHISLTDFIIANTGRNINKLQPGDEVNIEKMPLLLTVRVQKRFSRNEKVLENVPASEAGLQRVTYVVTYLNGQETQRDPIAIETIEAPQSRG